MEFVKVKVGQVWAIATYAGSDRFDGYRVVSVSPELSSVGIQHVKTGKISTVWSRPEWRPWSALKLIEDVP